ncbi:20041_t:CDS:2 [Entrophospora sp. SA101]|nr:20041_t:CDS:2 [Entrophospora sp. SA101]
MFHNFIFRNCSRKEYLHFQKKTPLVDSFNNNELLRGSNGKESSLCSQMS